MAAADIFPRGVEIYSSPGPGSYATVTLPGGPAYTWIVTHVDLFIYDGTAGHLWFEGGTVIQQPGASNLLLVSTQLLLPGDQTYESASSSWDGQFSCIQGNNVTIGTNAARADVIQSLAVKAYAI
jgi:hypothetical protein